MKICKKLFCVIISCVLCAAFIAPAFAADTYTPVYSKLSDDPSVDKDTNFAVSTENDGKIWTNKSVSDTTLPFLDENDLPFTGKLAQAFSAGDDDFVVSLAALAQTYKKITAVDSRSEVNVVLTIDNSTSMYNEGSMVDENGVERTRMYILKQAANTFIDALSVIGDTTTLNFAIVAYMGSASTLMNWSSLNTATKSAAKSAVNNLSRTTYASSNTNTQAGLYLTNYMLTQPGIAPDNVNDPDTKNFVIFMSDGGPNRYYNNIDTVSVSQNTTSHLYEMDKSEALLSRAITNTDYRKNAATYSLHQTERLHGINNLTMYTLGLSQWFTTESEDSGFPTAVNFLKLCAAVGNGLLTAEQADAFCGGDIPNGAMPGRNPHYPVPVITDFLNDGADSNHPASDYPYLFRDSGRHYYATQEELEAKFVAVCGDLETRTAQGVHMIPDETEEAIQNYYAGNTTKKFEDSFTDISFNIKLAAGDYVTTVTNTGMADVSGFVSIVDYPGEYMEVKNINGVLHDGLLYDGSGFARKFSDISWLSEDSVELDKFRDSLYEKNGIPSSRPFLRDMFLGAYAAGTIYYNNENDFSNYLRWYSNKQSEFMGAYYAADGSINPVPTGATYIVDSYYYWVETTMDDPEEHIYFLGVSTGIELATGIQNVCFNVPASLMPTRTVKVENAVASLEENVLPTSLVYTVGLKENLTNVRGDYPYYDDDMGLYTFYANAWDTEKYPGSAQAHAIYTPSVKNPFYFLQEETPIYVLNEQTGEYEQARTHSAIESGYFEHEYFDKSGKKTEYDRLLKTSELSGSVPNMAEFLETGDDGFIYARVGSPRTTEHVNAKYSKELFPKGNATNTNPYFRYLYYYSAEDAASNIVFDTGVSSVDTHPDSDIAVTILGNNGLLSLNSVDLKIRKVWEDGGNAMNKRPETVTLNIMRDGEIYDTVTLSEDNCTVTGDTWEYSYNVPFGYDYSVEEEQVADYFTQYSDDTFTITNTLGIEDTVVLDYGLGATVVLPDSVGDKAVVSTAIDTENSELNFGTALINVNGDIIYRPTTTSWNGVDTVYCMLTLDDAQATQAIYKLLVMPATNVYFEEDFLSFTDGSLPWENVGSRRATASQDGSDSYVFGYDETYVGDAGYSCGSAKRVTVDSGCNVWPTAYFEFYGTMTDIISYTGGNTGLMTVSVKNLDTGKTVKSYAVNTVYEDASEHGNLYQVPVLRCDMLTYGHYGVTLTAAYSGYFDVYEAGSYSVYVDAVRIYNPAGVSLSEGTVYDAYSSLGELNPTYSQLRDSLITSQGSFSTEGGANGAMYVSQSKNKDSGGSAVTSVETYEKNGPNHEVYLENNDAVAFAIRGFTQGDTVHISAKAPSQSGTARLCVNGDIVADVESATEQYFDITSSIGAGAVAVITNSGDGILSLVDVKLVCSGGDAQTLSLCADENVLSAAEQIMSSRAELVDSFTLPETLTFDAKIVFDGTEYPFTLSVDSERFSLKKQDDRWTALAYIYADSDEAIRQAVNQSGVPAQYESVHTRQLLSAEWTDGEWVTSPAEFSFASSDVVSTGSGELNGIIAKLVDLLRRLFRHMLGIRE